MWERHSPSAACGRSAVSFQSRRCRHPYDPLRDISRPLVPRNHIHTFKHDTRVDALWWLRVQAECLRLGSPLYAGCSAPWLWWSPRVSRRRRRGSGREPSAGLWWPVRLTSRSEPAGGEPRKSSTVTPYRNQHHGLTTARVCVHVWVVNLSGRLCISLYSQWLE